MAGIGFRLHRLLKGDSYTDLFRAYLYSAVISSGPMLVIIFSLVVMKSFVQSRLGFDDATLFMGLVIYAYAYSMLLAGPFFYVVTRYLADQYYLKKIDLFTQTYISVIEILWGIQIVWGLSYLYFLPIETSLKAAAFFLFLFVGGVWIAMIFLSAARNFHWIVGGFLTGGLSGLMVSWALGERFGLIGYMTGFAFGEGVIFIILSVRIFFEFGYHPVRDYTFLRYFKRYPYLAMIGFFYYLGTWIDKFIFWYHGTGDRIVSGLRVCFDYDTPMFFAFMTTVPSMAFFLIQMETSFVVHYRAYFAGIQDRVPFSKIQYLKRCLTENLSQNLQRFVVFQGLFSGTAIVFILNLTEYFHLNQFQVGIFRIGILGSFLHVGLLFVITVFFYFDFQKEVWWVVLCFLFFNGVLSVVSLRLGLPTYGFGYSAAAFISVAVAVFILEHKLTRLEYYTFMKQPLVLPQFKFESEDRGTHGRKSAPIFPES